MRQGASRRLRVLHRGAFCINPIDKHDFVSSYAVVTLYSALDQAPSRVGAAPGAALRETIELARHVDDLGFHRFWVAEHHSMGGVESSSPEVMIGHVAAATRRLRVGSGGVLLPNHRP